MQHCIGYFTKKGCLLTMGQHCKGKNLVQCYPKGSRQHCTGKNLVQCCLNTLGTTLHKYGTNILGNIVLGAPDNIAKEKLLFNIV